MRHNTENIWDNFNQKLYSFIFNRVEKHVETEDVLQEVFLKIHKNIELLNDSDKLPAWIYAITRNSIIDYYRKKGGKQDVEFHDYMQPQEFPSIGNGFKEIKECLNSFVNLLPDKYKESVELSEIKGIKQKEVAERLNISLPAAKSRILRGKDMIKQHFIDCCKFKLDEKGFLVGGDWPNETCEKCDTCNS